MFNDTKTVEYLVGYQDDHNFWSRGELKEKDKAFEFIELLRRDEPHIQWQMLCKTTTITTTMVMETIAKN